MDLDELVCELVELKAYLRAGKTLKLFPSAFYPFHYIANREWKRWGITKVPRQTLTREVHGQCHYRPPWENLITNFSLTEKLSYILSVAVTRLLEPSLWLHCTTKNCRALKI